ncbi:acyl-CoA dehydrogenase family protein [Amnimonas aquatica]|uniref:3-sulfinopropanoyl-CoA desulfinase n=1 Tax=Amnimonas aquatica TaxID=2094561 RepID=A0A2P6AV92_9GAMM|nr:acyl-CoA dehydrogenase family protein [Amnimonas aquatica]PQA52001.1 acyl-CoA dehydrogenase [Amnimonas aquatica]
MNAGEIQGLGLNLLNRFARSDWPDRLKVRKSVEKLLFVGSRTGFQLIGAAARSFSPAGGAGKQRLPSAAKGLFDLSLSEEQQMMRDTLQRFAQDVLRPAAHGADHDAALPDDLLAQAQELGLNFYAVPEALGGMAAEQSVVSNVLAAEDLGYGDFTLAAAILAPMGVANALTRWGSEAQQAKYLPAFTGEQPPVATFAMQEAVPAFDPNTLATRARRDGASYLLTGEKTLVLLGQQAELLLVSAELDGRPAVFIVEGGSEGLGFMEDPAMGLKAAQTVKMRLDDVRADLLGGSDGDFDYQAFLDLGALSWGAIAVGTCQAVLDYTAHYANERTAFGEPISHRQGVAFMIADMAIEIDAMRLLVWNAASLAEAGKPFHREAYLARLLCAEKAMKIGNDGVQILGGHGFTKEHPVERWYRDLRAVAILHAGLHA